MTSGLGIFFLLLIVFMLIQLLVNYIQFKQNIYKIKPGTRWICTNPKSPFYDDIVTVISLTDTNVQVELANQLKVFVLIENFKENYKHYDPINHC